MNIYNKYNLQAVKQRVYVFFASFLRCPLNLLLLVTTLEGDAEQDRLLDYFRTKLGSLESENSLCAKNSQPSRRLLTAVMVISIILLPLPLAEQRVGETDSIPLSWSHVPNVT